MVGDSTEKYKVGKAKIKKSSLLQKLIIDQIHEKTLESGMVGKNPFSDVS